MRLLKSHRDQVMKMHHHDKLSEDGGRYSLAHWRKSWNFATKYGYKEWKFKVNVEKDSMKTDRCSTIPERNVWGECHWQAWKVMSIHPHVFICTSIHPCMHDLNYHNCQSQGYWFISIYSFICLVCCNQISALPTASLTQPKYNLMK